MTILEKAGLDHFSNIYKNKAAEYHQMITREDAGSNLRQAINKIINIKAKNVLDIGSGTGRIPLILSPEAEKIISIDISTAMLREQQKNRLFIGGKWEIIQGDMRKIPIGNNWSDLTICGWAIGHFRNWYKSEWKKEILKTLLEMQAVTVRGGAIVVIETMSTGQIEPKPPTRELADYYQWLEKAWAFKRMVIKTDYEFDTIENAIQSTEFFFGQELSDKIRRNSWKIVPEWTGIWYCYK